MSRALKNKLYIGLAGLVFGSLAAVAVNLGNPPNMGLCVAGFISDTAGAIQLHHVPMMQYIRPEIIGFMLGSLVAAMVFKEWRPRGGASPFIRFMLGFFIMIGALTFLGCPIRMLLRIAGGDLNGITALAGLVTGVAIGVFFLKRGFSLGSYHKVSPAAGLIWPAAMVSLLVAAVVRPDFIVFSQDGPAAMHVPLAVGLSLGLLVGILAQRTRMCSIGAWRDLFLVRDTYLFTGIAAFFTGAIVTNYLVGNFNTIYHWGFTNEPFAHTSHVWNFLGMGLVGLAAVQVGACPFRNLILTGEGDIDAGSMVLGLFAGAAVANNLNVTSSPAGAGQWGPAAVITGWIFCLTIGFLMRGVFRGK